MGVTNDGCGLVEYLPSFCQYFFSPIPVFGDDDIIVKRELYPHFFRHGGADGGEEQSLFFTCGLLGH